jgi:DNA-binding MarR family transcriptional regulator
MSDLERVGGASRRGDNADLAALRRLAVTVVRAGRAGVRRVESETLRPAGLSYSAYHMLRLLRALGPHEPRVLARTMEVAVPSITSLVNTLERQGLVRRARSAVDGRLVEVSITEAGIGVVSEAEQGVDRVVTVAASALSREEQEAMQGYLERYLSAIGEDWSASPFETEAP